MVFLKKGGDRILKEYIADEIARTAVAPSTELARVRSELAVQKKDVDRLLDNLTAANRDFVDEKLVGIRRRLRELEARQEELETMATGPLDVEGITAQALAHVAKFREVLEQAPSTRKRNSCAAWWRESRYSRVRTEA